MNLSNFKIIGFLLFVFILQTIGNQNITGQSCVNSVYPTSLNFSYDPPDVQAVNVNLDYWCDTYTAEPSENWIYIIHIDYDEGIVYIVTEDNYGGEIRNGVVSIDGHNVTIEQECGPPEQPGSISGPTTRCKYVPGTYSISSVYGATYYTWSATNGGIIASGQGTTSAIINFPNTGISIVSVTPYNSCGEGEPRNLNVTVNAPTVTTGSNSPVCSGGTINLTCSVANSYYWTGPDSMISTQRNPSISDATTANSGTYYVAVTDANGCTNQSSTNVTVNPLPNPTASSNSPVISGESIHLTSSSCSSWSWMGPNNYSSNQQNPTINNSTSAMTGTYYLTVTDNNGCSNQTSTAVVINEVTNTSLPVGTISGSHNVSPDGSFNYHIPIDIPPGTAGIKPSISIFYNSSSASGILGKGWDIGGLSAISRVSQNTYNDTYVKGITLSLNDRFSMDGNRLILTSGATYGADNTKYHTEIESFSEVTAHGTTGYGPSYFDVITKEGLTLEYGNTTDSKIEPTGSNVPYLWRLNKTIDRLGNYITYTYAEMNGYSVISEISYTGFVSGHNPYNNILFQYETKTDKNTWYINGASIKDTLILKKIIIKSENDTVRQYEFKYVEMAGVSRLNEIIEYGKNNNKYNSTWINWYNGPQAENSDNQTILSEYGDYLLGDYNGDGRKDVLDLSTKKTYSMNNSGTDFYLKWETATLAGEESEYKTGDFNGDGKIDLVRALSNSSYSFNYYASTGTSFSNPVSYGTTTSEIAKIFPGDFNGDGLTDLLVHVPPYLIKKVYWGAKNNPFSTSTEFNIPWANDQYCYDFNGNGKAEIMILSTGNCIIYEWVSSSFLEIYSSSTDNSTNPHLFGDYNGDSKIDFIQLRWFGVGCYKSYSYISNGNGFITTFMGDTINYPKRFYVFDQDGDGMDELVIVPSISNPYDAGIYNYENGTFNFGITNLYGHPALYDDFDGDGLPECLHNGMDEHMWIANFIEKNNGCNVYSIINGLNNTVRISYKPLTDSTVNIRQTSGSYPVIDFGSSQYVVSEVKMDNGLGGQSKAAYFYEGAKLDIQRGRFLGFSLVTEADSTAGIKKVSRFGIDGTYYFTVPDSSRTMTISNNLISRIKYDTSIIAYGNKRYFFYISEANMKNYLQDLVMVSTYNYNSYGNLTNSTTTTGNNSSETNYTYINIDSWCPNRLTFTSTTLSRTNETDFTTNTRYRYDSNTGLLKLKVVQEGDAKDLFTTYPDYDNFGNPEQVEVSPDSVNGRNTFYEYDVKGRMITKVTNELGHYTEFTNDYGLGVVVQTEDHNGLVTEFTYDEFGQKTRTDFPDATWTTTSSDWAIDGNQLYYFKSSAGGTTDIIKYYDKLGREILSKMVNVNGDSVFVITAYNTKGQLSYVTLPYFKGESNSAKKTISYDSYGRVIAERAPGLCMKYTYNGKTVTINDSIKNMSKTREVDNSGLLIESSDGGGDITYSYYANRQVKQVTAVGLSTTMEYDAFGRQTEQDDPNTGTTVYGYNSYGQLITQTDALDQTISLAYDTLGRIKTRNEGTFNTIWNYNSNGTLLRMKGSHGVTQKFAYDEYKRIESFTDSINNVQLTTNYDYDANGRISRITYPSNFSVTYHYQNGFLKEIKRGDNQVSIWKLDTINAVGQITDETFGNGVKSERSYDAHGYLLTIKTGTNNNIQNLQYIYNSKGQMYQRKDHRHSSITETFYYDGLNRDTSSVINGNREGLAYANNGNINTKSDLGEYNYSQDHPHAVESVDCYGEIEYSMQDISYTSFKMADEVIQGDSSLVFTYGPDYSRKKSVTTIEGVVTTRYYSGGYEKIIKPSLTRELHYITAYGRIVALYEIKSTPSTAMYYVHTDHLGSVNCITDSTDAIVQETSFTAWGRRRDPSNWNILETTPANLITSRGFTGHEHIDEFNIINMNARIYDPILCRFLSPDPILADPGFTQDYNRYSYCLNNPLNYTDPSGKLFKELFGLIAALFSPAKFLLGIPFMGIKDSWRDAGNMVEQAWDTGEALDDIIFHGGNTYRVSDTGQPGTNPGTPYTYNHGTSSYSGYYYEDFYTMVNYMWSTSNDPSVNAEITGYILMDDEGKYYYWINDWVGNNNHESTNPYITSNDPKYKGHALFDNKIIVIEVHTHPKSYYEDNNAIGKYDGPGDLDYQTSVNMNIPVISIGPETVSVITPKSSYKTESDFKDLARRSYGISTNRDDRLKTNPFYWAELNEWLKNPTYVISW